MDVLGRFGKGWMQFPGRGIALLTACLALCTALCTAGCKHGVAGDPGWGINLAPANITITVPEARVGDEDATWTVTWTSANSPFTVDWNFGNGAEPNTITHTGVAGNTDTATATKVNLSATEDAQYTATVTVIDSTGRSNSGMVYYIVAPVYIPQEITAAR